jgi:xylulokinase
VVYGASDSAIEDYAAGAIEPGQCILKLATAGNST